MLPRFRIHGDVSGAPLSLDADLGFCYIIWPKIQLIFTKHLLYGRHLLNTLPLPSYPGGEGREMQVHKIFTYFRRYSEENR